MTAISVTAVICAVATGITFTTGAALAGTGRKHRDDNATTDALLLALSDFEVARRSLDPTPRQVKPSERPGPSTRTTGDESGDAEKLRSSVTLHDNLLYIFSYLLLHERERGLTEEQHAALQMLYDALRRKTVHVYNVLSVLPKLENGDKNQQTGEILLSLTENLPPYLQRAAEFLIGEIHTGKVNFNVLLRRTRYETFDYLANIGPDLIAMSRMKDVGEKMKGYDEYSNITRKALGPAFVRLLRDLREANGGLPQKVFGLILINLPNFGDDPVLEEHVRYIYDEATNNRVANWNSVGKKLGGKDAYAIVFSALLRLLGDSRTDAVLKNAAAYVYHHLKIFPPTQAEPSVRYMRDLIQRDVNMEMLLAAVVPHEFDADAIRAKDRLSRYFAQDHGSENLDRALRGFNKFGYSDPLDLLMALLTRFLNRVPALKAEVLEPTAALLSALIVKKHARTFTPFVSTEVDVPLLLESLKYPALDPALAGLVDSLRLELIAHPRMSVLLSTLIPTEKSKCLIARQCLMNTFQRLHRLPVNMSSTVTTKIQKVMRVLQTTAPANTFPTQFATTSDSVDRYDANQRQSAMSIGTNGTSAELVDNVYMSDAKKYVGKTNLDMQDESLMHQPEIRTTTADHVSAATKRPAALSASLENTTSIASSQIFSRSSAMNIPEEHSSEVEYPESTSLASSSRPPLLLRTTATRTRKAMNAPGQATGAAPYDFLPLELSYENTAESIAPKASSSTEEETSEPENASIASEMPLPPLIELDRPLRVQLSSGGVPVVTTSEGRNASETGIVLPEIKLLLSAPDVENFLGNDTDAPIVAQVLRPLSVIFGKNYIHKLLRDANSKLLYRTNVALLTAILKKARSHPQVARSPGLQNLIRKYVAGIEYVSPTVLLPVVISSKSLTADIIYFTFNPNDLTRGTVSESPPDESSSDIITAALVNPKAWLKSINPSDPYADLLPALPKGNAHERKLRPLRQILTSDGIAGALGPGFKPLLYSNRGTLLITLLHKLRRARAGKANVRLKSAIDLYRSAIETASLSTNVSERNLERMISESKGYWRPELRSLIYALPAARNDSEAAMTRALKDLLADTRLLERLHLDKPALTVSRGEFLREIILNALSDDGRLEKRVLKALKYYGNKVTLGDAAALPIAWVWVRALKAEEKLGEVIRTTLSIEKLTRREKSAYNGLMSYLNANLGLVRNSKDFAYKRYKTQGEFARAFLRHLLKEPDVSARTKKDIRMLIPRVMLSGLGTNPLPSLIES